LSRISLGYYAIKLGGTGVGGSGGCPGPSNPGTTYITEAITTDNINTRSVFFIFIFLQVFLALQK